MTGLKQSNVNRLFNNRGSKYTLEPLDASLSVSKLQVINSQHNLRTINVKPQVEHDYKTNSGVVSKYKSVKHLAPAQMPSAY